MTHSVVAGAQRFAPLTPPAKMTLRTAIEDTLPHLTPRQALAFRLYCGVGGEPHTLEEVGRHLDVTRERARQLRDTGWKKVIARHPEVLSAYARIAEELEGRSAPLTLEGLTFADPWFAGLEDEPSLLDFVLDCVSKGELRSWSLDGQLIICRCKRDKWFAIRSAARELLTQASARGVTKGEAWAELEKQTRALNVGELTGTLWESIVGSPLGDPAEILRTVGTSRAARIRGVLRSASAPLTITEIAVLIGEEDRLAEPGGTFANSMRTEIRAAGGLNFGRSLYGRAEHVGLPESSVVEIVTAVEALILDVDADRQWHAAELHALLQVERPDLVANIDAYALSVLLHRSQKLRYMKRLVWGSLCAESTSADRLEVAKLSEAALEHHGGPMSNAELRSAIEKVRGTNTTFLLTPWGRLVRLGVGRWGLVDRDIGIGPDAIARVMDALVEALRTRQVGLHLSEMAEALRSVASAEETTLDDGRIWGLAQRDPRFTCTHGMLVGLAEWESVRRLSVIEAAARIRAEQRDNLTSEDALGLLERYTERPLPKQQLSVLMGGAGYAFDATSRTYRIVEQDAGDEAED